MTDETPKLARCPFVKCGGEAEQIVAGDDCYYTYCVECGIQSPSFTSAASAAEWWNRRAERPAWISVADRLPDDDVDVLFTAPYGDGAGGSYVGVRLGTCQRGHWFNGDDPESTEGVTHWQPLLAPPEAAK